MTHLADFLLARIADDEARVSAWYAANGPRDTLIAPGRLLAECGAQRQIVHNVRAWSAAKDAFPGDRITSIERELTRVLRYLGLSYADHPDYREEWKP